MSIKRKLTPEEIRTICDRIPLNTGIPIETAVCVRNGIISTIEKQLASVEIYPEAIPKLGNLVEEEYYASLLQPGEMVGVQAATSIGEPVSQMTLNAFHNSGISTVGIASGVPRIEEILNASKKQKSYGMTLYFKQQEDIHTLRRKLYQTVTEVYMSNLITNVTVEYIARFSDLKEKDQMWYSIYLSMFNNDIMDEQTQDFIFPWRIRLELNRNKMYQHSISCIQVAEKVQDAYRDLYAIPSPDNIGVIDIYVDFEHMKLKKKEEEDLANLPYKEMVCMRNIIIPMLQDILISGISGIEQVHLSQNENKEWIVNTQGSNLMDIFQNDLLDHHRCLSSDIWEIRKTLGIEATRQFIINEFYKVLAGGGASVGRRHLELLADSMTFQGKISSVNRYGIDRNETGPLAKASFEESVNNFFIAAANGEKDEMGVSSSVMAGKLAQFGTGYFDLVVDPESFKKINVSDLPDPIKERDKIRMQEEMVKKMRNVSLGPSVPLPQKPIFPSSYAPQRSEPRTGSSIIGLNLTNFDSMVGPVQENIHPMFRIPEEKPTPPPRVIEQKNRVAAKPVLKQAVEEVDDTQKLSWTKKKPAKVSVSFSADD